MIGDRHKPIPALFRWMIATVDGLKRLKGNINHPRIPSNPDKKFNRRWNRRQLKKEIEKWN